MNVLNSSAPGGLTTERCFVSLPDTPARRAGFTHTAGSGVVLLFEKLHRLDKPEGTTVSTENLQRLKSYEIEFSLLLGARDQGIKLLFHPNEHSFHPISHDFPNPTPCKRILGIHGRNIEEHGDTDWES